MLISERVDKVLREQLGAFVKWDGDTKTVHSKYADPPYMQDFANVDPKNNAAVSKMLDDFLCTFALLSAKTEFQHAGRFLYVRMRLSQCLVWRELDKWNPAGSFDVYGEDDNVVVEMVMPLL